ncbi:hypothetical protein CEXT_264291 [Caerostris extrusa]|uniref:Uncharacterized protein n=1 Tax=Caerostris extrusa TaxID=172846 RepID=A0AAV4PZ83_CAEEX|nr:hypothetical protein CEXT_264291 [Caerostris extrusa]
MASLSESRIDEVSLSLNSISLEVWYVLGRTICQGCWHSFQFLGRFKTLNSRIFIFNLGFLNVLKVLAGMSATTMLKTSRGEPLFRKEGRRACRQ